MQLKTNLVHVPRILMWTAAAVATTALVTIIVVQLISIIMTTRPPMLNRWLTGLFVICQQAILASIGMGVASYALHATQPHRVASKVVVAEVAGQRPAVSVAQPLATPKPDSKLPADLRSAIAQASGKARD